MRMDSHVHAAENWYEPVETLLHQMDRNGIERAVLVQIMGEYDNDYQFACQARHPGRFANVVLVDATRPDALGTLAKLADRGACGVRLRPADRSPGDDPLAIWRQAEALGLTISCAAGSGGKSYTRELGEILEAFPGLQIVLEHLGRSKMTLPDPQVSAYLAEVYELARYPNLSIKFHGLGEFSRRAVPAQAFPFVSPVPDALEAAHRAFGGRRMLWGSDWPPVAHREGYANALRLSREVLSFLPAGEIDEAFGKNAARLFPVR